MSEIRYTIPYFSTLDVVLNEIKNNVQIKSANGSVTYTQAEPKSKIATKLTGWIGNVETRSDNFSFVDEDYTDILLALEAQQINIRTLMASVFDQIAETFPTTREQNEVYSQLGPAVYMRLEKVSALFEPSQPKHIKLVIGIYSDSEYTKLSSYLELKFEEDSTINARNNDKAQLVSEKSNLQKIINGEDLDWDTLNDSQKEQRVQMAENRLKYVEQRIKEIESEIVGKLSDLIGAGDPDTVLQTTVKGFIGVLCASVLTKVKEINEDYNNINVAAIMQNFKIPEVN